MPTWEDIAKEMKKHKQEKEEFEKHLEKLRLEYLKERGIQQVNQNKNNKNFFGNCDSPSTMENGTATLFWIVAMVVSLLFKGGWALCILETIAWWKFITRHKGE